MKIQHFRGFSFSKKILKKIFQSLGCNGISLFGRMGIYPCCDRCVCMSQSFLKVTPLYHKFWRLCTTAGIINNQPPFYRRFHNGRNQLYFSGNYGEVICFDFQENVMKEFCGKNISISTVDSKKVREIFFLSNRIIQKFPAFFVAGNQFINLFYIFKTSSASVPHVLFLHVR